MATCAVAVDPYTPFDMSSVNVMNPVTRYAEVYHSVQLMPAVTVLDGCQYVQLSGADYSAIQTKLAAASSSGTGTTSPVNTTSYPAWNELGSLSLADVQVIGPYIWLLWSVAWIFKQIAKALNYEGDENEG